eukprot:TRINITY_DN62166_c0_g1_i1.p2 TRINITY_DN62166_c0_g1~~TRINITY_DN62166_c0_g1_i1.p2  ORF type:complete len:101 (-),score=7.73 TRINITY_DN62166_c0_g1_i1:194-496(-)
MPHPKTNLQNETGERRAMVSLRVVPGLLWSRRLKERTGSEEHSLFPSAEAFWLGLRKAEIPACLCLPNVKPNIEFPPYSVSVGLKFLVTVTSGSSLSAAA